MIKSDEHGLVYFTPDEIQETMDKIVKFFEVEKMDLFLGLVTMNAMVARAKAEYGITFDEIEFGKDTLLI